MHSYVVTFAAAAFFINTIGLTKACTCMFRHPQEHYCQADFVILARVKREFIYNDTRVYKIQIRKEYKMSEKSYEALKSGRLLTSREESLCGLSLRVGKVYAISGRVKSLKATVNLCDMHEIWRDLSKRQRKGLKRMYGHGCTCEIKKCYSKKCPKNRQSCMWTTTNFSNKKDCQRREGICLRSRSGNCIWTRNAALTSCMKNQTKEREQQLTISRWSG